VDNFGGDLELKRLDLTWSGQVDLTAATLRSSCGSFQMEWPKCSFQAMLTDHPSVAQVSRCPWLDLTRTTEYQVGTIKLSSVRQSRRQQRAASLRS